MPDNEIQLIHGIPDALQDSAFNLYLHEFKRHNATLPISEGKLIKLLTLSLDWRFALAAVHHKQVIGLAGYQCQSGAFTGAATPVQLLRGLGISTFFRLRRSYLAASRKARPAELVHDGLMVSANYRRQGVATQLLKALAHYAKQQNFKQMRLDVAEHNLGAIALYQKMRYRVEPHQSNGHWVYRRQLNTVDHWAGISSEA